MAKRNLVVVESAAKARTIDKYLGPEYVVRACLGHVRDLPEKSLGVKVDDGFLPQYVVPKAKAEVVKQLRAEAKKADSVFLATDPDREGEAIAWHLAQTLLASGVAVQRVEFHEVTKAAVLEALAHPRAVDTMRVDAQQARRVLDRLVGYKLSPLLWKKVRRGLSAGRVQSVAVRLVVDREREIEAFVPREYWSLDADLSKQGQSEEHFRAALIERAGKKVELSNGADTQAVVDALNGARYTVRDVRTRDQQRHPAAPFTTSTLQQEANRKLNFTAKRTMAVAQALYEGMDIGEGETSGLITYMRTDSVTIAESAQAEARSFIATKFGGDFVPSEPRVYRTRSRLAQEAHEAIRPTGVMREPNALRRYLNQDQLRLYDLIWKRFVASQMASAVYDVTTLEVDALGSDQTSYMFRASGSRVRFPGFLSVYRESRDDDEADEDAKPPLPLVATGDPLDLLKLMPEQHFTQPPARYSEATLVKAMEEKGIGRPSTYAPTLSTIQDRRYVERADRRFKPTELGLVVNDLLVENFAEFVDLDFTANFEEKLDDIARGEREWVPVIREFYEPLEAHITKAMAEIPRQELPVEMTDEVCEKCGKQMAIKMGRFGRFLACTGFPDCKNAKPIISKIGVDCPLCGGDIAERKSRKGRVFFGCVNYPTCSWSAWQRPVPEPCPKCGGLQVQAGRDQLRCLTCNPPPVREVASGTTGDEKKTPAVASRGRKTAAVEKSAAVSVRGSKAAVAEKAPAAVGRGRKVTAEEKTPVVAGRGRRKSS
ncbi:MAG: type I DNA topoisomerase [Chloroflexota bacterium]